MKLNLPIRNIHDYLSSQAKNRPTDIALSRCNKEGVIKETISYKELKNKIEGISYWLLRQGLGLGDVLGFAMTNSPELLIISWACWSVGIITVPLDIKRDTTETHRFKLRLSKAKLLIAERGLLTEKDKQELSKWKLIETERLDFSNIEVKGNVGWTNSLSHDALILFTSGTEAYPKGAQLTLQNLVVNADSIRNWFKITSSDRFMVILPLYHINSTTFCIATLLAGASIAFIPSYSNSKFWQEVALTSSTFTSIVPSICFDQLTRKKEFEAVKKKLKLNRLQIGSAPVVVSDVKKFMKMYEIPIYQGYGQTETALRVTGVSLDLDKKTYASLVDSNSIGTQMRWATVEIVDDKGKILDENKDGELAVKGEALMKGYLNKSKAFKNGYFFTGDIGYYKIINGDRYFFLKGRKKEIIIKGGINISPVAVEDKLKKVCSYIDQVFVIGISDRRFGEEIAAVICWKNVNVQKEKAFLKYTLARGIETISRYETPKYIADIDSKDLPTTSTGKVQRLLIKNKISPASFEPVNLVVKINKYSFRLLTEDSLQIKEALELYNYCWHPLPLSINRFKDLVKNSSTIMVLDIKNKIKGLVTFLRVDMPEEQLSSFTYTELVALKEKNIVDNNGNSLVCISICGPNYKQEPILKAIRIPNVEEVKKYLLLGKDSVYNFHLKPKGGFDKGASLVKVLPNSRPEDKRALGYNMLLKYPKVAKEVYLTESASIATQLIEAVMLVARSLGIENVYAFSRPAALAQYMSQKG